MYRIQNRKENVRNLNFSGVFHSFTIFVIINRFFCLVNWTEGTFCFLCQFCFVLDSKCMKFCLIFLRWTSQWLCVHENINGISRSVNSSKVVELKTKTTHSLSRGREKGSLFVHSLCIYVRLRTYKCLYTYIYMKYTYVYNVVSNRDFAANSLKLSGANCTDCDAKRSAFTTFLSTSRFSIKWQRDDAKR